MEQKNKVHSVVIDGGPGSGKTTGLVHIIDSVMSKGIVPVVVPETATELFEQGFSTLKLGNIPFQKKILSKQLKNENFWRKTIEKQMKYSDRKFLLLHDRGILSGAAYLDGEDMLSEFQKTILRPRGLNVEKVRQRYDGVIHLVTAANGAPQFYSNQTNVHRKENLEMAIAQDEKTQRVWLGHRHLAIIPNTDKDGKTVSFQSKMERTVNEVLSIMGLPIPLEIEDRYLLRDFHANQISVPYQKLFILQTYLKSKEEGVEERVRRRVWENHFSYLHTTKRNNPHGVGRIETERHITKNEYDAYLLKKLPNTQTIRKIRYCFIWKYQYFEVDVFEERNGDHNWKTWAILERKKTDANDRTELPNFIKVERDITNDKSLNNFYLAQLKTEV